MLERIEPVNIVPERFYLPEYALSEQELESMYSLYIGDIAYLDFQLGGLFEFMRRIGVMNDTVVIVTSDHGENFGEYGLIEHTLGLYNSLLHVPLIIRYPREFLPGKKNDNLVSTSFLYQTIRDLLGETITGESAHIEKRSLLSPASQTGPIYAEYENMIAMFRNVLEEEAPKDFNFARFDKFLKCIYSGDQKLIWSSDMKHELYDMAQDWGEMNLIGENEMVQGQDLFTTLREWLQSLWKPKYQSQTKTLDKKTEEALKSLGYIK
jgi:arylsulfatase A-like enzyme